MAWGLLGLEQVKTVLSDMLRTGRLPHGLLLVGPRGTGKLSMAKSLAQALNCLAPEADFSPCGRCMSCRKIAEGLHPDVQVLEGVGKTGQIAVEDVRSIRTSLTYRPYEGRWKAALVRGADHFNEVSGSALLKTLEEPTPNTVIVLTAESSAKVMETLVSRCVAIKFYPPPRPLALQALAGRGLTLLQAALAAGLSGGALGAALDLDPAQAQSVWESYDRLMGAALEPGGALLAALDWTANLMAELDKFKKVEETTIKTARLDLTLNAARLWWRDVGVLAVTGDSGRLLGPPPSRTQTAWALRATAKKLETAEKAASKLADGLQRSLRLDLLFENYWLDVLD
ncbi:MAG: hypothetical protein LBU12_00235 [Deltaproteobacteria bacterium]|jgi:DNA polymerase-3 subunit delta'|nr:hypothetical protein [Deltaproteobacteria bacterium]